MALFARNPDPDMKEKRWDMANAWNDQANLPTWEKNAATSPISCVTFCSGGILHISEMPLDIAMGGA